MQNFFQWEEVNCRQRRKNWSFMIARLHNMKAFSKPGSKSPDGSIMVFDRHGKNAKHWIYLKSNSSSYLLRDKEPITFLCFVQVFVNRNRMMIISDSRMVTRPYSESVHNRLTTIDSFWSVPKPSAIFKEMRYGRGVKWKWSSSSTFLTSSVRNIRKGFIEWLIWLAAHLMDEISCTLRFWNPVDTCSN